ncbi:uncharacterized protein LOC110399796 [Numida meleagris]|uniref:uncharacterized protein LOC110399796 n=1 Tax=Numida meleagris TaxID=8996 RepID=UPI000B3DBDF0|nr:uncharacterized protein LOC110399796 [Numida meleagris]
MGSGGTRPGSGDHVAAPGDKEELAVPRARQREWSAMEVRGSGGKGRAISAVQSPGIPGQEEGNLRLESCVRLRTLQPQFAIALRSPRSCSCSVCGSPPNEGHEFLYHLLCFFGFITIILSCGIFFCCCCFLLLLVCFLHDQKIAELHWHLLANKCCDHRPKVSISLSTSISKRNSDVLRSEGQERKQITPLNRYKHATSDEKRVLPETLATLPRSEHGLGRWEQPSRGRRAPGALPAGPPLPSGRGRSRPSGRPQRRCLSGSARRSELSLQQRLWLAVRSAAPFFCYHNCFRKPGSLKKKKKERKKKRKKFL